MLHELSEGLQYSHHAWLILCANREYYDQHPDDRVLEILNNGPETYFNTAGIKSLLDRQAKDCQASKTTHTGKPSTHGTAPPDHDNKREIKHFGGECGELWVAVSEYVLAELE
jgi:hypothetical protein